MEEIWKPVPSCPGMTASSLGFIRLPERAIETPSGGVSWVTTRPRRGVKTRASKTARHYFYGIYVRAYGNKKVHRLVCEAFHGPAPFPRAVVIHLDEDALNNAADNLRWGTQKENLNMPGFRAFCQSRVGEKSAWAKHRRGKVDV